MTPDSESFSNSLASESSAYLESLAGQPVDWVGWSEDAFAHAKSRDIPVLLSVGCGLCRRCAEVDGSFADPVLASYLNRHFVCVKVDAFQIPEVEGHYAEALAAMSEGESHPMTVFLDPEGAPFYGRSWFPSIGTHDVPALPTAAREVVSLWEKERAEVAASGAKVMAHLQSRPEPAEAELSPGFLQRAVFEMQALYDEEDAGFGEAPKLPRPVLLDFLLRVAARGVPRARLVTDTTLKRMALSGTYDQVGGGFHRRSATRNWGQPEFEKPLALNAMLARVYLHAWQLRRDPLAKRMAQEICEFMLRDLNAPGGSFWAGVPAGPGNGEYYRWSQSEMTEVAQESPGSFELISIDHNAKGLLRAVDAEIPGSVKAKLYQARSRRDPIRADRTVIAGHNGLAIGSLAEIGAALNRPDLVEAARRAASRILGTHWDAARQRLARSGVEERTGHPALLEDCAFLADGLFTLWETTFEREWLVVCEQLCQRMIDGFWDRETGGFFAAGHADPVLGRTKSLLDGELASGYGVAASVLQRLGVLTGNTLYERRASEALQAAAGGVQSAFSESASMLAAMDFLLSSTTEVVIAGPANSVDGRRLTAALWGCFEPLKVVAGGRPRIPLPMLENKPAIDGKPTAYVSQGGLVKAPITDPADLPAAMKFWEPPTPKQVDKALELISNGLQRRHFFDNLQNPSWVGPLADAGQFAEPPAQSFDFVEGTILSPPWPESRFLARMAPLNPIEVAKVALAIPEVDNTLIHEDLADVALGLPAEQSARFVEPARRWLASPYLLHLPEKLSNLVEHLAKGGQSTAALELAAALLELEPLNPAAVKMAEWMPPEPQSRVSRHQFEQFLTGSLPALVNVRPLDAVNVIADALESAIELSAPPGAVERPHDYSFLWRPAVHPHAQNADKTLRDPLVSALVEAAELAARSEPALVPELVATLEKRGWLVFHRIALHLLRVWPDDAAELIRHRIADRRRFEDPHLHREYLLLAQEHMDELSEEQVAGVLEWIVQGPDSDRWRSDPDWGPGAGNGDPEGADPHEYRERWMLKRLSLLSEFLTGEALERYRALLAQMGEPEAPDFVAYAPTPRPDPTTPLQAEALHEMEVSEIVAFIHSFRPVPGLGNPTPEGLARKLSAVVSSEPVRFAQSAAAFVGEDPIYVWAVCRGLQEAGEGTAFDWESVLELCRWAVSVKPGAAAARWRPARREIARLLSRGFIQGPAQIPDGYRQAAWNILRPLTDDPDPTYDATARTENASARSTESVRGEAMHAVARYALWVRRQIESGTGARLKMSRGLGEMPEVAEVLEAHLDPASEPEPAIRAVFGRWFAWFVMLDPNWANGQLRKVFPLEPEYEYLRDAAWEAHISFCPPYDYLLDMIGTEYERGVKLVDRYAGRPADLPAPENRLAEHLMVFYLRGKLALDKSGLLARFFASADPALKRHALAFVGRSMQTQDAKLPRDLLLRMKSLWERRIAAAGKAAAGQKAGGPLTELKAFGWWFASGKLDDSWALTQLGAVLDLGVRIDAPAQVVGRLKELDEAHAERAIKCLAKILLSEQHSPNLMSLAEDARSLLTSALNSANQDARTAAIEMLRFFDVQELEELVRWE